MARYRIEVKRSAEKELRKLPKADVIRILTQIEALADDPRPNGSIKLTNQENYRVRVGKYRVLYSIEDDILTVYVVKVGHRKDVYR